MLVWEGRGVGWFFVSTCTVEGVRRIDVLSALPALGCRASLFAVVEAWGVSASRASSDVDVTAKIFVHDSC